MLTEELISNKRQDSFSGNYWTDRGNQLEPEAVRSYEAGMGVKTVTVGFITDYQRTMGCSPDRLVGTDGLLEVKCPSFDTHTNYRLSGEAPARYYPQLQGQLLITGRDWVDFYSYHPGEPHFQLRIFRNEDYLSRLRQLLKEFTRKLRQRFP